MSTRPDSLPSFPGNLRDYYRISGGVVALGAAILAITVVSDTGGTKHAKHEAQQSPAVTTSHLGTYGQTGGIAAPEGLESVQPTIAIPQAAIRETGGTQAP